MSQKFFLWITSLMHHVNQRSKAPLLFFLALILYLFKLQFCHYRKLDSKDWNLSPLIDSEQRLEDTGPVKQNRGDPIQHFASEQILGPRNVLADAWFHGLGLENTSISISVVTKFTLITLIWIFNTHSVFQYTLRPRLSSLFAPRLPSWLKLALSRFLGAVKCFWKGFINLKNPMLKF